MLDIGATKSLLHQSNITLEINLCMGFPSLVQKATVIQVSEMHVNADMVLGVKSKNRYERVN